MIENEKKIVDDLVLSWCVSNIKKRLIKKLNHKILILIHKLYFIDFNTNTLLFFSTETFYDSKASSVQRFNEHVNDCQNYKIINTWEWGIVDADLFHLNNIA